MKRLVLNRETLRRLDERTAGQQTDALGTVTTVGHRCYRLTNCDGLCKMVTE